jgi:hypothetical protein
MLGHFMLSRLHTVRNYMINKYCNVRTLLGLAVMNV